MALADDAYLDIISHRCLILVPVANMPNVQYGSTNGVCLFVYYTLLTYRREQSNVNQRMYVQSYVTNRCILRIFRMIVVYRDASTWLPALARDTYAKPFYYRPKNSAHPIPNPNVTASTLLRVLLKI